MEIQALRVLFRGGVLLKHFFYGCVDLFYQLLFLVAEFFRCRPPLRKFLSAGINDVRYELSFVDNHGSGRYWHSFPHEEVLIEGSDASRPGIEGIRIAHAPARYH
jgi:hypothetical protein